MLNRWESNYTQHDVSVILNISKRTVSTLEKGECTTLVTIFNYIHFFGKNNAQENLKKHQYKFYNRKNER